jgi:hypothetical protein
MRSIVNLRSSALPGTYRDFVILPVCSSIDVRSHDGSDRNVIDHFHYPGHQDGKCSCAFQITRLVHLRQINSRFGFDPPSSPWLLFAYVPLFGQCRGAISLGRASTHQPFRVHASGSFYVFPAGGCGWACGVESGLS